MSPWDIDPLHLTIRLVLSLVLGGLIGFERERSGSAAGFRTHILVCIGSTLIMLLSIYGFSAFVNEPNVRMDPARLAAQVISGIGFLGAGTILRTGLSITGLTTAASLWVVAAIGLAIGAGFYYPAVLATWIVIISLWVLSKLEKRMVKRKGNYIMQIHADNEYGILNSISDVFEKKRIVVTQLSVKEETHEEDKELHLTLSLRFPQRSMIMSTVEELRQLPAVRRVSIE